MGVFCRTITSVVSASLLLKLHTLLPGRHHRLLASVLNPSMFLLWGLKATSKEVILLSPGNHNGVRTRGHLSATSVTRTIFMAFFDGLIPSASACHLFKTLIWAPVSIKNTKLIHYGTTGICI